VTELRAECRDGQTFLTWRELSAQGRRYRIYRAEHALVSEADLARADYLGEVDDRSSRNQGRSLAAANERNWIIVEGAAPLDEDQGLFVYTVEGPARSGRLRAEQLDGTHAWYAVTSVQGSTEHRTLLPGSNASLVPVHEVAAPPRPVLQSRDANGELYAHWVGERDTPYQRALSPWPSRGFNYLFQPGTAPGPRGLVVTLHAAGQTYSQGWPNRFEVPPDVDILKLSDLVPYTGWSFWYGTHEALPGTPGSDTPVWNFTQQRILWTLDERVAALGAAHDPERVYVAGGSMGALGGMYLVNEYPERFAAAILRNGLFDLEASDYRNPFAFERIFGSFELGLRTLEGLPILQRTNASFMAALQPERDWPVLRTLNGRNDETVGWLSAVELFEGLARAGRPAVHYFDERTHNPNGYWRTIERALLARTFQTRRDRPSMRFDECSLDDDPGAGERTDGDEIGTINGYVEYDTETASRSETRLDFEVYLRAVGALDDAPGPRASAVLTPCRTGDFRPALDEAVHYTQWLRGELVDEHLLFADEYGRVRTPPVQLERAPRAVRFERGTPATSATLFVGAAPRPGEAAQVVLRGQPGADWTLFLRLGYPSGAGLNHALQGQLDERGLADLGVALPRLVPSGTRLLVRAQLDGRFTPFEAVQVQPSLRPPKPDVQQR
jgi:pimeloyl-ACP methyl ester carboxylesterase